MIAAVVLAAGAARRFGRPKQIVDHEGRSLVRIAVEAALDGGCDPVFVVLGANTGRVRPTLEGLPVRALENPGWKEGMASSIRVGVDSVAQESAAEAVLLMPSDLPRVDASVVRRLLAAARRPAGAPGLAACAYAGTIGPPSVFPGLTSSACSRSRATAGAKAILLEAGREVRLVDWPDGALDLDHPPDRR